MDLLLPLKRTNLHGSCATACPTCSPSAEPLPPVHSGDDPHDRDREDRHQSEQGGAAQPTENMLDMLSRNCHED